MSEKQLIKDALKCLKMLDEDICYNRFPQHPKPGCLEERLRTKIYNYLHRDDVQEFIKAQESSK